MEQSKRSIRQCMYCWNTWERGTYLRADGQERQRCPKCNRNGAIDTHFNPTEIVVREDLLIFTNGQYPKEFCPKTSLEELSLHPRCIIVHEKGVKIFISRGWCSPKDGHYVYLFVDRKMWMTTDREERESIDLAVTECPENARVFVAGLGLGYVLLALARSKKAKEVIVVEWEQRVIDLVGPIIRRWLKEHYSDFKWSVVQGDAVGEIENYGKFDWVFYDIWSDDQGKREGEPDPDLVKAKAEKYLTPNGKVTLWTMVVREMREKRITPEMRALFEKAKENLLNKDGHIKL